MNRRRFLQAAGTVGLGGLFAGCLNTEAKTEAPSENDRSDPTTTLSTPEDPITVTDTPTRNDDDQHEPSTTTTTADDQSSTVGWSSGGTMDGLAFQFSSDRPACGQGTDEANLRFKEQQNTIVFDGVISGSDLCKRARLADLTYDRKDSHLSITIESVDQEGCGAAGQCIVDIAYEGSVAVEEQLPESASVSHDGQELVSAAHDSASAGPPETTTSGK